MLGLIATTKDALKSRLGPLWWYSLVSFIFARAGDVISLYVGAILVPSVISSEQLGAVLPLMSLAMLATVPLAIPVQAAAKFVNRFLIRRQHGKILGVMRDLAVLTVVVSAVLLIGMLFAAPFIKLRLRFEDTRVLWLILGIGVASQWNALLQAVCLGLKRFSTIAIVGLVGPLGRLVIMLLLLHSLQLTGYFAAWLGQCAVLAILFGLSIQRASKCWPTVQRDSYQEEWRAIGHYIGLAAVWSILILLQNTVEPWVIRQRLSPADSAAFYVVSVFGRVPLYLAGAVSPFLFSVVSEKHEQGDSTRNALLQTMGAALALGGLVTVAGLFFGEWLLDLRAEWRKYIGYADLLWQVCLASTCWAAFGFYVQHELACRRFRFMAYAAPLVLGEVLVLYGLNRWDIFRTILSADAWAFGWEHMVGSLQFTVGAIVGVRCLLLLIALKGCRCRS
jgi:O-antigen/teichoic acid export membrane protein